MDSEDFTLEEKCENLMNAVVERRKRLGNMCIDYEQKISLIENKLLYLQLNSISNHHFKPKYHLPEINMVSVRKVSEGRAMKVLERQKRIEDLKKKLKDAHIIVLQIKKDEVTRKMRLPLTTEVMLSKAKEKMIE